MIFLFLYWRTPQLHNTKLRGLQHKYKETALILTTNICSVYCRHCFRKRLVGTAEDEVVRDWDSVIAYIREHKEITNVLLSGGDPLVLQTTYLQDILRKLSGIKHIQYVRIGSRVPVVLPQRISEDDALHDAFKEFLACGRQLYITAQYNHMREMTTESLQAIGRLQEDGVIINNQTVLLKGVNDSPTALAELQIALTHNGILPYYVFQCRPVTSVKNEFQVPLHDACQIVDKARQYQDGLSKRYRFVMAHPTGKIEILGWSEGGIYAKYLQTNQESLHNKIFHAPLTKDAGWLDTSPETGELLTKKQRRNGEPLAAGFPGRESK
ncbi:MAG: KamA family radical SAM protein [Candidatus Electrothrix sp. AS4_5]|nr:KamA family radical SAM protein [Candidatus Electrothrix gigas]